MRLSYEAKDERTQLMAIKIYMDATQVKKSEVKTMKQVTAPIILPASRPDPAAEVVPLKKAE